MMKATLNTVNRVCSECVDFEMAKHRIKIYEIIFYRNIEIKVPVIQGGMGVGISLSGLASAVANEGGVGVISCAGLGLLYPKEKALIQKNASVA